MVRRGIEVLDPTAQPMPPDSDGWLMPLDAGHNVTHGRLGADRAMRSTTTVVHVIGHPSRLQGPRRHLAGQPPYDTSGLL